MMAKGMLSVARAAVASGPVVFIYTVRGEISAAHARRVSESWEQLWLRAGSLQAPPICLCDDRSTITSLTDEALRDLGLMRIDAGRPGDIR